LLFVLLPARECLNQDRARSGEISARVRDLEHRHLRVSDTRCGAFGVSQIERLLRARFCLVETALVELD